MSPTSYQAAPPRKYRLTAGLRAVKSTATLTAPITAPNNCCTTASDQAHPFDASSDTRYSERQRKSEDRQGLISDYSPAPDAGPTPEAGRHSPQEPGRASRWHGSRNRRSGAVADSQDQRTDASRTHSCQTSKDLSQSGMPLSTSESLSTPCVNGGRLARPRLTSPQAGLSVIQRKSSTSSSQPTPAQTREGSMSSKNRNKDRDGLYQRNGKGAWYFKYEQDGK